MVSILDKYGFTDKYIEILSEESPDVILSELETNRSVYRYNDAPAKYEQFFASIIDRITDELYDYDDGVFQTDALHAFYLLNLISGGCSIACNKALINNSITTELDFYNNRPDYIEILSKSSMYSVFNKIHAGDFLQPQELPLFIQPLVEAIKDSSRANPRVECVLSYLEALQASGEKGYDAWRLLELLKHGEYDAPIVKSHILSILNLEYNGKAADLVSMAESLDVLDSSAFWNSARNDVSELVNEPDISYT